MKYYLILIFLILYINCQVGPNQENPDNDSDDDDDNEEIINPIFQDFINEWEEKMQDFDIQYTHLIPVKYKTPSEYYENITRVPCTFRGAFILEEATSKSDAIDFKIIAPNRTIIYEASSIGSVFQLNLTEIGLYKLEFYNRALNKEVRPNLMINSGQNTILEKENLSKTEKKLDNIVTFLRKYEQDTKLTKGFKRIGNEELSKTNKYFVAFSIIETIVLIGVSIWQYLYLKHLFEIKGSL